METHVKVLAILYIVFGAIGAFAAFVLLAVFGAAGMAAAASADPDAWVALPILGITGSALAVFVLALSVPCLLAGYGLLKYRQWGRILTIVLSALNILNIPFGTALGIYGLWVLLSENGARLFALPAGPPALQ